MFFGIFFGMMEPLRPAATPPGEGNTTPACGHPSGGGEYHPARPLGRWGQWGRIKCTKTITASKRVFDAVLLSII